MENTRSKFLKSVAEELQIPKGWLVDSFIVDQNGFEVGVSHEKLRSLIGVWSNINETTLKATKKEVLKEIKVLQEEYEI